MAAFATSQDLQALLQLPTINAASADLHLAAASNAIRGYLRQDVEQVLGDSVELDSHGRSVLLLPAWPVTAVDSVTLHDGTVLVDVQDYEWGRSGVLELGVARPRRRRAFTVVYDHGWSPVPGDFKDVALAVAGRSYTNPGQLSSETIGDWARGWRGTGADAALSPSERERLAPYRRGA